MHSLAIESKEQRKKQILEIFRVFIKEMPLSKESDTVHVGGDDRNQILVIKQEILYKIFPPDGNSIYPIPSTEPGLELNSSQLTKAYLPKDKVDLKGVNLQGAGLRGANLKGTNLQGADLSHADLQGADLQGADLREIKTEKTIWDDSTQLDYAIVHTETDICKYLEDKNITHIRQQLPPKKTLGYNIFSGKPNEAFGDKEYLINQLREIKEDDDERNAIISHVIDYIKKEFPD